MKKAYYAIRKGHQSGVVVESWDVCKELVDGCKGAIFKGFPAHQKKQAEQFAKHGDYGKYTPKAKPKKPANRRSFWDNEKYPCIKRGDYWKNGIFFKNRCIMRRGPTMVGEHYSPSGETGVPWQ